MFDNMNGSSRAKQTVLVATGQGVAGLASIIVGIVLSRVLSLDDYATYRQTILAAAVLLPFLMLGLPNALSFKLPGEVVRPRAIIFENLILLAASGSFFVIYILAGGSSLIAKMFNNNSLVTTLPLIVPYVVFNMLLFTVEPTLLSRSYARQYSSFMIVSRIMYLVLTVGACLIYATYRSALIGASLWAMFAFLWGGSFILASTRGGDYTPRISGMMSQLKFGVPLGLAGMLGTLSTHIDKLIVSSRLPPADFAIYSNGTMQIPLLGVVFGSINSVLIPGLVSTYNQGEASEMFALWKRTMVKSAMIVFPITILLYLLAESIITFLYSTKYEGSIVVFKIFILNMPFRIVTYTALLSIKGKNVLVFTLEAVGLAITAILAYIMTEKYGYIGAAYSSVIINYLMIATILVIISHLYTIPFRTLIPYTQLGLVILLCTPLVTVLLLSHLFHNTYINLFLYAPLSLIVTYLAYNYSGLLSRHYPTIVPAALIGKIRVAR